MIFMTCCHYFEVGSRPHPHNKSYGNYNYSLYREVLDKRYRLFACGMVS